MKGKFITTTLHGGTVYGLGEAAAEATAEGSHPGGLPEAISHTFGLEARAKSHRPPLAGVAVANQTTAGGAGVDDVCLWGFAGRAFRVGPAVVVALQPKRRRPGGTLPGFQLALARLPTRVLRAVIGGVRARLAEALGRRWQTHGFVVLGCDGSRLECGRISSLERRLGEAGKADSAPSIWLTAIVHLATGVPWAWRFGKGTASERDHLKHLLGTLPAMALIVCDAGYIGFDLCRRIMAAGADFLIRMTPP